MLLSLSHSFVFVHVPKTAGSALHSQLEPLSLRPERTTWRSFKRRLPIRQAPGEAHFRIHETAKDIRATLGPEIYDPLHSFAVVREPFDHAVSHFEYMKQYRSPKIAAQFETVEFLDYLKMRSRPRHPWQRIFVHLPDQAHFLVDRQDRLLVDRILHYESLGADIQALQEYLGLDATPLTRTNVTRSKSGKATKMADYYGPEEIALVKKIYARDFKLFGYDPELVQA